MQPVRSSAVFTRSAPTASIRSSRRAWTQQATSRRCRRARSRSTTRFRRSSAAATTQPNSSGWYNAPVSVHYTCDDATSGVWIEQYPCPADHVFSDEGAELASPAMTTVDRAGNVSAPSNVVTVKHRPHTADGDVGARQASRTRPAGIGPRRRT